ncbi:hypothetical protein ACMYML_23705, partial [Salmonella enterica subsp. enterica serovar Enteritidis]|uniref:hypothetical protein n=1 Tax=Salmonella enterica TaxID=28901 RepID=UPI0039E74896
GQRLELDAIRRLPDGQLEIDGQLALNVGGYAAALSLQSPLIRTLVHAVQQDWLAHSVGLAAGVGGTALMATADALRSQW